MTACGMLHLLQYHYSLVPRPRTSLGTMLSLGSVCQWAARQDPVNTRHLELARTAFRAVFATCRVSPNAVSPSADTLCCPHKAASLLSGDHSTGLYL